MVHVAMTGDNLESVRLLQYEMQPFLKDLSALPAKRNKS